MAAPGLPAPTVFASADKASTSASPDSFAKTLVEEISSSGTSAHGYPARMGATRESLADAAHFLCLLHGNQPDVADLAAITLDRPPSEVPSEVIGWLRDVSRAFTPDRLWLAQLAVLAGSPTRSFGLTATENMARAQRDAMLTLAQSGRAGCALGAAAGFALDWCLLRPILDAAAQKHLSTAPLPPLAFPAVERLIPVLALTATTESARRALRFGAVQMLTLHRGLWDLLESRNAAALS